MSASLTEREAEVYDRQIRLWGLEAQRRMKDSKVLVLGLGAANAELCKNIVLAGISVDVCDCTIVEPRHLGANFFLAADDVGKQRGAAALHNIKELNPLVSVSLVAEDLAAAVATGTVQPKLDGYTMVCASGLSFADQVTLDAACRAASVKLVTVNTAGLFGHVFVDLGAHEYVTSPPKKDDSGAPPPAPIKFRLNFPSLQESLAATWDGHRRTHPLAFAFRVANDMRAAPAGATAESALAAAVAEHGAAPAGVSADDVQTVAQQWGMELSPVAAVLGGVIGQEVVKALSCKDEPLCNVFVFDGRDGTGAVAAFPKCSPDRLSAPPAAGAGAGAGAGAKAGAGAGANGSASTGKGKGKGKGKSKSTGPSDATVDIDLDSDSDDGGDGGDGGGAPEVIEL